MKIMILFDTNNYNLLCYNFGCGGLGFQTSKIESLFLNLSSCCLINHFNLPFKISIRQKLII